MPEPEQNSFNHEAAVSEAEYSQPWVKHRRAEKDIVRDLQRQLEEARVAIDHFQLKHNAATTRLAAFHQTDTHRKDDDEIRNMVKGLRYQIKQWSLYAKLPKQKKSSWQPKGSLEKSLEKLTRYHKLYRDQTNSYELYQNPDDFQHLVQAFIWAKLLNLVFQEFVWTGNERCLESTGNRPCIYRDTIVELTGTLWRETLLIPLKRAISDDTSGELNKREHEMEDVAADREAFHSWRAQTSRIIPTQAHSKCIDKAIDGIAKEIAKDLKGYVEKKEAFNDRVDGNTSLASIVASAVRLDRVMAEQKAYFSFDNCYRNGDKLYFLDTVWMDPEFDEGAKTHFDNSGEKPQVQLFRAPALNKHGTSEGKEFDKMFLVLKAEVDCKLPAGLYSQEHSARPISSG